MFRLGFEKKLLHRALFLFIFLLDFFIGSSCVIFGGRASISTSAFIMICASIAFPVAVVVVAIFQIFGDSLSLTLTLSLSLTRLVLGN